MFHYQSFLTDFLVYFQVFYIPFFGSFDAVENLIKQSILKCNFVDLLIANNETRTNDSISALD